MTEWIIEENEYGIWKIKDNIKLLIEPSQKWIEENPIVEPEPQPLSPIEIIQEDLNQVAEQTALNTEDITAVGETVAYNLEDSMALGEALALALEEIAILRSEIDSLKGDK